MSTFSVLNDDKSKDFNDSQPPNIINIFLTFPVLNLDKSNVVNELHPENI